jgi:hypothetical protein
MYTYTVYLIGAKVSDVYLCCIPHWRQGEWAPSAVVDVYLY